MTATAAIMVPYRFPVPQSLTPEAVLHVAKRLAEAAREGYDINRAAVDGRFFVVPAGRQQPVRGSSRTKQADGYRADICLVLKERGDLKATEIGHLAHLTTGQIGYLLRSLMDRGQIEQLGTTSGARYRLRA